MLTLLSMCVCSYVHSHEVDYSSVTVLRFFIMLHNPTGLRLKMTRRLASSLFRLSLRA
jgi:hypothetical protein